MSNFDDIYRMHQHHQLPIAMKPTFMNGSDQLFREGFMREELMEFEEACNAGDLAGAADALIDLVVAAMGTAVMMGFPWQALWLDVLRANMSKERIKSDRAHGGYDLGKPEGWEAPKSIEIVGAAMIDGVTAPIYLRDPKVICLCGSTRFKEQYIYWNRHFTLKGYVVLSVGFFSHGEVGATAKAKLDQLHLHKIDMSDGIFVINISGYIGDSTRSEIEYARSRGKEVRFLEPETIQ